MCMSAAPNDKKKFVSMVAMSLDESLTYQLKCQVQ